MKIRFNREFILQSTKTPTQNRKQRKEGLGKTNREREREKCDEIGSTSVHTRSLFQLLMFQAPAPSGSPEKSKIEETEEDEHNNDDDQVFRVGRLEV